LVRAAHLEVHGREPHVTAVHAWLEAGEIAAHLPGLVAVSIGPTVEGAHSPKERLDIASMERFYDVVGVPSPGSRNRHHSPDSRLTC